jgi:hypothetical protein
MACSEIKALCVRAVALMAPRAAPPLQPRLYHRGANQCHYRYHHRSKTMNKRYAGISFGLNSFCHLNNKLPSLPETNCACVSFPNAREILRVCTEVLIFKKLPRWVLMR